MFILEIDIPLLNGLGITVLQLIQALYIILVSWYALGILREGSIIRMFQFCVIAVIVYILVFDIQQVGVIWERVLGFLKSLGNT